MNRKQELAIDLVMHDYGCRTKEHAIELLKAWGDWQKMEE